MVGASFLQGDSGTGTEGVQASFPVVSLPGEFVVRQEPGGGEGLLQFPGRGSRGH